MSASLTVDPASSAKFAAAIQRMYNETPRSVEKVLELGALSYVQSGRKVTPAARKGKKRQMKRRVEDITKPSMVSSTRRYVAYSPGTDPKRMPVRDYTVLTQHAPPAIHTVCDVPELSETIKKLEAVPHVKAAKNSWYGIMRSLGKTVRATAGTGEMARSKVAFALRHNLGGNPAIIIANRLSYLLKIAPAVNSIAKTNAAKQIITRLEKLPAKGWK